MDELASALGLDPVELRLRNEPETEPDSGRPFSSRGLAACLRDGAARFGWQDRDPRPAARQEGRWLIGTGVASATYPVLVSRSTASAHAARDGAGVDRPPARDAPQADAERVAEREPVDKVARDVVRGLAHDGRGPRRLERRDHGDVERRGVLAARGGVAE